MSAPIPEVFKIFSLHRYFMWAVAMREHYQETGQRLSPTPSFFESEAANEAFMYLSYWYAGLYVVCEGWQELKLSNPEIDALLSSPHLEILKRFRNGVYHFQPVDRGQTFHAVSHRSQGVYAPHTRPRQRRRLPWNTA
jgi:hypothetical protein